MLILGLSHPRFSTSLAFPHKNPPHSHLASPFFSHFFDPANTEVISIDFFSMRSNFMLMLRNGQHHHQTLKVVYLNIQTHYMQSSLLARVFFRKKSEFEWRAWHVHISRKIPVLLWKDKSYLRSEKNSYSCQNIFYRIFSFLRKAFSFSAILIFWWSFFPPYLLPPKLLRRIFVLGAPIFMRRSFIVLHMSWNLSLNFWGLYLNAWKAQKSSKISPAKREGNFEWNRVFSTKLIRQTVHLLNDKAWLFLLSLWSGNA